jgi:hypothetical protein
MIYNSDRTTVCTWKIAALVDECQNPRDLTRNLNYKLGRPRLVSWSITTISGRTISRFIPSVKSYICLCDCLHHQINRVRIYENSLKTFWLLRAARELHLAVGPPAELAVRIHRFA